MKKRIYLGSIIFLGFIGLVESCKKEELNTDADEVLFEITNDSSFTYKEVIGSVWDYSEISTYSQEIQTEINNCNDEVLIQDFKKKNPPLNLTAVFKFLENGICRITYSEEACIVDPYVNFCDGSKETTVCWSLVDGKIIIKSNFFNFDGSHCPPFFYSHDEQIKIKMAYHEFNKFHKSDSTWVYCNTWDLAKGSYGSSNYYDENIRYRYNENRYDLFVKSLRQRNK